MSAFQPPRHSCRWTRGGRKGLGGMCKTSTHFNDEPGFISNEFLECLFIRLDSSRAYNGWGASRTLLIFDTREFETSVKCEP
ncbi:5845_t:CDS:2, partial [Acaulospora morrowiae]